jgi:hypothetical protein
MRSWFVAGIAGALCMFAWMSLAHMATPLATTGFSQIPNEPTVLGAMHNSMGDKSGLYIFPWVDPKDPKAMDKEQQLMRDNPSGLLIYHPPTANGGIKPSMMLHEFLKELVTALIAAFLLSQTALAGYVARVGFVSLIGFAAAITTNVSYWVWYAFPASYTLAYGFIDFAGYVAAGLAIAAVLRRPSV